MVSNVEADESSNSSERKDSKKAKKTGPQYDCNITCLDGKVINTPVEKSAKGEELFNDICDQLDIKSKDYVGLLFDNGSKQWLDLHKNMKHQIGDSKADFFLRVKFYEPEPTKLQDEYMRYLLYLQLREDLSEKRLKCSDEIIAQLGAYTAQVELGDFNLSEHEHDYLNNYDFSENKDILKKVHAYHKQHRGQTPLQAESNFLEIAKKIPRYGVDIHDAMDTNGPVEIGIAAIGINIYRNGDREILFRWQNINDFNYNRRKFTVKLKEPLSENDSKKTHVYFFDSAKNCKQCYKVAIEYHAFFRLTRPDPPRKRVDSLKIGSSFRYSDRTLYQLRHQSLSDGPKEPPKFTRTPSTRRTLPHSYKQTPLIEPEVPFVEPSNVMPVEEEPVVYEEVEIDEANPEDDKYDPKEWETVEKTLPDGTKKRYRRRIIVVKVVKKPKDEKSPVDEEPVQYEEVEIDEANPEDDKYDPKEWETVEKTLPDGTKKRYRRRIIVVKVVKKPKDEKSPVDEEPVQFEEVEIDEANPEDDKYDPKEWETVEKTLPDGTKKRYRRRVIVVKVVKKPKDEKSPVDEEPVEYEEVEIDEANPEDDKYDPKEWEVVEKQQPDGRKVCVRRRKVIILMIVKKPDDLVNENEVTVEEMPLDQNCPDDEGEEFDPEEWETIEKLEPDGSVKKYRRRIFIVRIIRKSDEEPVDENDCKVEEVPLVESESDMYDPDEWQDVERTRPDGTVKRYRRRLHIMKVVKNPSPDNEDGVNYEEEEITDQNADDPDKYDPEEWEELVKTQPDGSIKRFRRRIIVVKFVHGDDGSDADNERRPVFEYEEPIKSEEIEVDENSPDFEQLLEDPDFEIVHKKRPDGTVVRVKRRAIRVTAKTTTIPKNGNNTPLVVEETPIEFEEVEVAEDSPEFLDALDDPDSEIIEKKRADGTVIRVRRRAVKVTARPSHARVTITSRPSFKESSTSSAPEEEGDLSYEEIPVDENSPVHFDKNVWEEYDKVMPDGSTKKYRRRFISKCNVILLKKPTSSSTNQKTPVEMTSSVVVNDDSGEKYEEVDLEDNNEPYNPEEWEVFEKEQPDGTKKRFRRRLITVTTTTRYVIHAYEEEENVMESKPLQTMTFEIVDGKPVSIPASEGMDDSLSPVEMSMSMDDLISEINQISMSLDTPHSIATSPRNPVVVGETVTVETTPVVNTAPVVAIDEEELKRREEAERHEQEGLNATIDSIFTLPDDEEVRPLSLRRDSEDTYDASFDHELEEYGLGALPENTTAEDDFDFQLPDPTVRKSKPKTAPKPANRPKSHVDRNLASRSGSESDESIRNRTPSDASKEQSDFLPRSGTGTSGIIYTVTDVSLVEQGVGGFVKAAKAKHEHLAHEEMAARSPRSSKVFVDSPLSTPKGHVPTQTISFDEDDCAQLVRTTEPPSVPVKPTVIVPAQSELPVEDVIFPSSQCQDESYPDNEENIIEATEVPEVETEIVLIKEGSQDDVRIAPSEGVPGIVRTRPLTLPRQDTQVIKTEIIEVDLTPSHMDSFTEDSDNDGELTVSTEQLPTEVITKTITIEGDSTDLTQEEIENLLSQAPEEIGDYGKFTTTQVVRTTTIQKTITGKTITVSGDAEDEELQRMLNEAVTSETNRTVTRDEDGNVIITAIQDEIIEDGSV